MPGGVWLILGLGAAVGDAGADVVTKRYLAHLHPYAMGLVRLLASLPFLLPALYFIRWPGLDGAFWWVVAVMLPLEVAAMLMYMRVLRSCHLSLCIPFLAFTPVFLILTGQALLGEGLNRWGVLGTLLIAGGSYILSLGTGPAGWWAPLKALVRESGPRLMLVVAAIYSCTAALFKLAILHSEPVFFGVAYPLAVTGVMLAGYPVSGLRLPATLASCSRWVVLAGFFLALSILCLAQGITLAPAAYLIAVKRLSLLLGVLLGGLWLKERPFLPRLVGAVLMFTGVALIALKG